MTQGNPENIDHGDRLVQENEALRRALASDALAGAILDSGFVPDPDIEARIEPENDYSYEGPVVYEEADFAGWAKHEVLEGEVNAFLANMHAAGVSPHDIIFALENAIKTIKKG